MSPWLPSPHPLSGFRPMCRLRHPATFQQGCSPLLGLRTCRSSGPGCPSLLYPLRKSLSSSNVTPMSPPQNPSSYLAPPCSPPELCTMVAWLWGGCPLVCELRAQKPCRMILIPAPPYTSPRTWHTWGLVTNAHFPPGFIAPAGAGSVLRCGSPVNALAHVRASSEPPRSAPGPGFPWPTGARMVKGHRFT